MNFYIFNSFKNPFSYLLPDHGKRRLGPDLDWRGLAHSLEARGWKNLNHSKSILTINDTTIEARGTDDAHLNLDDYAQVQGAPAKVAHLAIGVTHAPYARVLEGMNQDGLDVIFAGHLAPSTLTTVNGRLRFRCFGLFSTIQHDLICPLCSSKSSSV